jgi:hypothetical protein
MYVLLPGEVGYRKPETPTHVLVLEAPVNQEDENATLQAAIESSNLEEIAL